MGFLSLVAIGTLLALVTAEYTNPHCNGRQVIVHLFEWKWTDIAVECERFLSKKGYCGVQVSPPNEHVMVTLPEADRPWWERYQPISYRLTSRGGIPEQFKDMVDRCKAVGVRIFVDAVVNHMAGLKRRGVGTAGSSFDSDKRDFPGVPFSYDDFHQPACPVDNYGDPRIIRNCYLVGLTDLDQSKENVREKITGFLNHLVDLGVAGFRFDASKHMWPEDLKAILGRLHDVDGNGKPFCYHEVIDQNDGIVKTTDYTDLGYVTEFRYCQKLAWGVRSFGDFNNVVDYGWHMTPSDNAFVFVDNHDNQRGHGGGGNLVTHKTPRDYKMAVAFMLAYNYGFTRVMSSYYFGDNSDQGPPHNADYSAKDVTINADGSCGNGWVCEHRWAPIANLVAFRNTVTGTDIKHWYNQNDVVAFARGTKGFFVMAKQGHLDQTFQTGLPAGTYCDLVSDCQQRVTVDGSGNVHIVITNVEEPILAFIVGGPSQPGDSGAHHGSGSGQTTAPVNPTNTPNPTEAPVATLAPVGFQRTVIFIQHPAGSGEEVFFRGGVDQSHRGGCRSDAHNDACAIPIKHNSMGSGSYYSKAEAWSQGDNFFDWYGAEAGQGSYQGQAAGGTPGVLTTNRPGDQGYTELNKYGQNYWMLDVQMDCSKTVDGMFEVKVFVHSQWESNINLPSGCSGSGARRFPYGANNHWARCGFVTVLHYNRGDCEIHSLPSGTVLK